MYIAVPSTMQMQAADCGAASLKMLLDYYKAKYTLEEVRTFIGVGNDGSTIGDIRKAAERLGMQMEAKELDLEGLHTERLPCILWWDHVHFVVYEGSKGDKEIINDPAIGRRRLIKEEFIAAWTGVAIVPTDTKSLKETSSNSIVSDREIVWYMLKGSLAPVCIGLILNTLGIFPTIILSQLTSYFTDQVLILNQLDEAKSLLWSFLGLTGASALLAAASYYLTNRADYITGIRKSISFFELILNMPMKWQLSRNPQELASRVILPTKMVSTLTYSMISSVATMLKTVIILVFVFAINSTLASLFLLVFVLVATVTFYIEHITQDNNQALAVENGKQQSTALGTLMNLEKTRCVGEENLQFSTWSGYYTNYTNFQQKISISQSYASLASFSGTYLFTTILVISSPILIIRGEISIGDFIGLQFLVGYLATGVSTIPTILTQYQSITSPITRLRDAFEGTENYNSLSKMSKDLQLKNREGGREFEKLIFRNVSFEYRPGKKVLSGLNLEIDAKKITCLTASPGSGATTLLRLASGLLYPSSGDILRSSQNINSNVAAGDVKYINSDPTFFDADFASNITLMNRQYTTEEINRAVKDAGLFSYIKQYPKGINSEIPGHGQGLSNLNKNRLIIARVLIDKNIYTAIDDFIDLLSYDDAKMFIDNLRSRGIGTIILSNKEEFKNLFDNVISIDPQS